MASVYKNAGAYFFINPPPPPPQIADLQLINPKWSITAWPFANTNRIPIYIMLVYALFD